jgi:hypothetical protein
MNPFTTDHPMTTQTAWFDAKKHPWWTKIGHTLALALSLTPLAWCGLYRFLTNDEDGLTTPGSNPLSFTVAITVLVVIAFAFSLVGSIVILLARAVLRLGWQKFMRRSKSRCGNSGSSLAAHRSLV